MGISNEAIRRLESKYKGISNDTIRRIENMAAGYTPPMAESTQEVQTPAMQTEQVPNIQRVSVPRKFVSMYKANQMPTTAGEMAGGAVQGANLSKTGMPITDKWNLPQNKFVSVYRNGGDTSGRTGMTIGDELQNGRENILRNMQNGNRAMTEEERAAAIQDFTNASQGLNSWDNTIQGNINARQNYLKAAKESEQVRKTLPKATRNATLKDLTLNSFKRGYMQSGYGQESYKSMMGLPNSKKYYEDLLKESEYNFAPNTWYKDAISGAMEQLGQQARQWTDPRSVATGTAAASAAFIAGQAGPQAALPEEVITVPGAFAVGINAGSTLSNFEIEAGLAYNEMIENGVSEETARNIATGIGAGNAALEFVQADDLLKSAKILNRIDSKNPVTKKLLLYLKDRGVHVATESAQEMAQETVTAVGSNIGSKIDKGEWEYSKGDVAKRVGQTGASSALTFGALGLGTDAVNFGTRKLMSGADRQTADNVADVKNGANENTVSADNQPIQNELNRRKFRSVYADNNANDAAMIKSVQNEGTQEKTQEEINRMSDDEFMDYMSSRRQQSDNVRKNMVGRQKIGIGDEVDWTYGNDFKGTGYVKDYVNDGDMSYYVIEDDNGQLLNLNDENDIVTITPKRQVGAATSGKTVDIDERSYAEFSDRKVKAYQYEYPAVKRFYKEKAAEIAQDVRDTIKGERIAINDPTSSSLKYIGVNRVTSDMVARIKDTSGASYADITSACERIINDRGTENIKLCKLIEGVIDDALTDGYTDFRGQKIEPNSEYIELKNIIQQGGQRQALNVQNVQNEQSVQPNEGERIKFRSKIVQEQNTQAYNSLSDGQKQAYEKLKQSDGNVGSVVNAVSDRQKYAVSLAKRLGYDVVFFDGGKTNSRGATVDGVIFINDRQDALEHITGHEVMHNVISDENVKADFLNTVKSYVESSNEFKAVFEKKRQMYEDRLGKEVSDDYIWEEVAADIGGDLFGDSEFITKVTREQPSLAKRIVESIRELINKLRNSLAQRTNGFIHPNNRIIEGETLRYVTDLEKLEKAYVKAIRENTAVNTERFSIESNDKGKYVKADRQVIKSDNPNDWEKEIYDYINESIRNGKDIVIPTDDGDNLTISEKTAWKMGYRNTVRENNIPVKINNDEYRTKINAAAHIDEISEISQRGKKNVPDRKNHNFAQDGFNYRTAYFEDFDGERYKLTISVGENAQQKTVYNIGKIKKSSSPELRGSKAGGKNTTSAIKNSLQKSISDNGENVNTQNKENVKFSVDDKENEIYSENFKRWFGDWENNPKKASKVVNADGTPKIMYHGSGADFTVFDKKKAKYSGTFGRGFYFTDSKSHAGTYGKLYEVYLDVKNPVDDKTKVTNQQLRNFLEAVAEDEDYSIENYGTYDIDEIIPKINQDSLFTVLRDVSSTAIGDMVEATELFNKVNGTNYDGIFSDTEYVVFKPNQIKSATDNIGTFDKGNDDIRFSLSDDENTTDNFENGKKITSEMSDDERYEVLKDKVLKIPRYDAVKAGKFDVRNLENIGVKNAKPIIRKIAEQFGITGKTYKNQDMELEFDYSKGSLDESIQKQKRNYGDFAKMLSVFNEVVDNAIGIEVHNDRYKGTEREDVHNINNYVLVSAFSDNEGIIPVRMLVKEFDNKSNTLRMVVSLNKIEDRLHAQTPDIKNAEQKYAPLSSNVSLSELIKNVNSLDADFLKYVPDAFLSSEQKSAKEKAMENEKEYIDKYKKGSDKIKFYIDDENTEEKPKQKVSKFRTNTLERAKMTEESPHGLFGTNETEEMNEGFEYKVRGKRTYESEAKAYLENDYDGEAASIRESNILTDTQVAEAQIIADDLYKKYLNSGKSADLREFTDWTKVIAQKTREAARALKATDTVWEKNKAVKTVMEAEKAVNEVEELKGKTKVIDQKTKQVTDKLKDIEDIGIDELMKIIDRMKLTPDLLMEYINSKPKKGSAETDQTESGKRQADVGNNEQRNEDIDAAAAELTNRIKNRVDSDGKPIKEKLPDNMLYRMVNDLFGIAKETIKTDRPKFDNTYKDIKEAVENRGEYARVWRETKDAIKEMYKDNPKALELLEEYFERGVRPPVPLSVADSGINKALRELNINLKDVVKEYYTSGESTKTALVEYIKEQTGLSGENAQAISRMIENRYRQLVKAEKEKYLKGLFSSRPKLQKDFRYVTNKITEILNADGYRNQTYIDRINEKINPLIAEAIRQKKINLAEVVKNGYKATNWEQLKFIQSLKEQLDGRVSEDDLFQFWETAQSEFARLAQVKRDSILKQKFAQKEVGEKATQLEKILELINLGAYDTKSVVRDMIKEKSGLPTLGKADTEYIIANVEMAERFAEGSRERDVYMAYAMKRIQEKIPSDLADKVLSLQRIAMLLNPKTMIRNVVGNAIMQPVYTMQDTLFGAGIDKLISKKTNMRTTSVSNVKEQGKGFAKGLTESVDDFRKGVNTRKSENGKYELGNKLVWKNKGLQKIARKAENFMSFLLDAGDRPFYEAFYNDSIEQQKRANKTDIVTEEMKQIARDTALQRTWQDTNETTKAAQSLRKGINKLFGGSDKFGLGNIVMPFVQTPANLTKALVKYSPVGLTKSLTYDAYKFNKAVKNGTADFAMQKRFVDKVSAGLAGTLIYLLSFALTKLGAVNGGGDDDYDKARFEKSIKGIQPYSIKVGNQTYTFDWAQPVGGLMAAAADVASGTFNHESAADIILKAFEAGGNTMFDQSFLTGVKDLFGEDTFVEGLENIALEMPKQWLTPTALKQLADVMDDTARNTYDPSEMKKKLNEMQTRVPFKSRKLEPRLNVFGEEQERISGGNNIFNVFANPAYVSGIKTSQITEEVDRLNKATGNTDIYPSAAPKTVDSQKLTAREYTEYQRKLGTKTKTLYNDIIADKDLESVF